MYIPDLPTYLVFYLETTCGSFIDPPTMTQTPTHFKSLYIPEAVCPFYSVGLENPPALMQGWSSGRSWPRALWPVVPMEITFIDTEDEYQEYGTLSRLRYI